MRKVADPGPAESCGSRSVTLILLQFSITTASDICSTICLSVFCIRIWLYKQFQVLSRLFKHFKCKNFIKSWQKIERLQCPANLLIYFWHLKERNSPYPTWIQIGKKKSSLAMRIWVHNTDVFSR